MKKILFLFLFLCGSSSGNEYRTVNFDHLTPRQLQLLCNTLYFSCKRIALDLELQRLLRKLNPEFLILQNSENKGRLYKTSIPRIMDQLAQIAPINDEYRITCASQELIIDHLMMSADKIPNTLFEHIGRELSNTMQEYCTNNKDDISVILEHCKTELAAIAGTFQIIGTKFKDVQDQELTETQADQLEIVQKMYVPTMQVLQNSFALINYMQTKVVPYHFKGLELLKNYYVNAYNALKNATNDHFYFTIIANAEEMLSQQKQADLLPEPQHLNF